MADNKLLVSKKDALQSKVGRLPVLLLETFQNWGMTQQMTVISVKPKTVDEVIKVVKAIKSYNDTKNEKVSLRCVGDGHSWSPLFPDNENVLMFISQLIPTSGKRIQINELEIGSTDSLTVTIAPGVTTGELSKFFTETNVCFKSNVVLDKVTYGGVIAPGCHGVGKDQLAMSDYVTGMTIVGADGVTNVHTFPSDNPDKDNALKCNMGLFGVMTSITMEVQPMVIVKVENDFSHTVGELFYDHPEKLKKLYEDNWSLEIFWFPFNSLDWPQLITLFVTRWPALVGWDQKKDKLWIRKINPVNVPDEPTPNQVEYDIKEVTGLISTGFGRILAPHLNKNQFLIPSFLKAGFEMVKMFNTTTRFEPMNKAIHYQSFIEVMPVLDMEFAFNADPGKFGDQVMAMQHACDITKEYYNKKQFPLSVAMEMRWMAYSDCLICPAHAVHTATEKVKDKQTLYIEVLGLAGQENWENYTNEIAEKWMEMKINGMSPLPHWAKQWSYLNGIDDYIKKGYGANLTTFRNQVGDAEKSLFSNTRLNKVIFQDPQKESEKPKIKHSKSSVKAPGEEAHVKDYKAIMDYLKEEHVKSWETFFMTLGEQVWNVPFKFPKLEIQKEWENSSAILSEINKKYPHLSIEEDLYKNLFS